MRSSTSRSTSRRAAVLLLVGCAELRSNYRCEASSECTSPVSDEVGVCEPNGWCSFADPGCPSGRRYGDLAGEGLAGDCATPLISLRASTSTSLATGDAVTIDVPAAVREGDLLWLALYASVQDVTLSPPAGWTPLADLTGVGIYHVFWLHRTAGASEPGSATFGFGTNVVHSAILAAYANVTAGDPLDGQVVANVVGNPFTAASFTTTVPNTLLVLTVANEAGDGETWTAPAGMTMRADTGVLALFDAPAPDAGPTGPREATCSLGGEGSVAFVALEPN